MRASVTFEWTVLVLVSATLMLLGFVVDEHILVVLSLPSTLLALGSLVRPFSSPEISISMRSRPARISAGESTEIDILIENTGRSGCYLSMQSTVGSYSAQPESLALLLGPGQKVVTRHRTVLPRGRHRLPPIELRIFDDTGFRVILRRHESHDEVEVWPRSELLSPPELDRASVPPFPKIGQSATERSGSGTEWLGVRTYYAGDPLRRVNWRAWARTRQLYTNDYAFERSVEAWVVLDARSRSYPSRASLGLFEASVSACASLSRTLMAQGHRVALYVYGGAVDDFVPLGTGPRHVERVLARLSRVSRQAGVAFSSLSNFPTQLIRLHQLLYLVSPLVDGDAPLIERLSVAGYRITVVSPDPLAFRESELRKDEAGKAAWRIARIERTAELRFLARSGCIVVDWDPRDSLSLSFRQVGRRRE